MENYTTIQFEIKTAASKILSQVMVNNEKMQKELEEGITAAIENFDFKTYIEKIVTREIESAITNSGSWGSLRTIAKMKADQIVDAYIEKEMANFKDDLENHKVMLKNESK